MRRDAGMKLITLGLYGLALLVAAGSACSSSESGSGTAASSSSSSSGGEGGNPTPPESCAQPGDKGNSKGVGEYCTPSGGECQNFPEAGLCLATVGQDQWMCARIGCDEKTDCGENAGCKMHPEGSACILCRCDNTAFGCPGGAGGGGGASGAGGGGSGGAGGN